MYADDGIFIFLLRLTSLQKSYWLLWASLAIKFIDVSSEVIFINGKNKTRNKKLAQCINAHASKPM